jgi:phospholipid N-methyltransferase
MTDLHASTTFLRRALAEPTLLGTRSRPARRWPSASPPSPPAPAHTTVVELGPGNGALTVAVRARLPHHARYLAVELDPGLCRHLAQHLPWLQVVHGDAADLPALLAAAGISEVDLLVASLALDVDRARPASANARRRRAALAPGGVFAALTHLTVPPGRVPGSARRPRRRVRPGADQRTGLGQPAPARLITGRTGASC